MVPDVPHATPDDRIAIAPIWPPRNRDVVLQLLPGDGLPGMSHLHLWSLTLFFETGGEMSYKESMAAFGDRIRERESLEGCHPALGLRVWAFDLAAWRRTA
jgi:hypothetical protein